jgi:pSer/pThr/pTyr-binding forkhead associated (FHA) protein
MYGQLVPIGGGDPIPLLKSYLSIGRRESCDIVLRFGNVSGQHCELMLEHGWWFVKDLNSQNGTRVNGLKVSKKRLDPGDRLTVSRHDYEVRYSPKDNGGDETRPPEDDVFADIMGRSLMESAGLDRKRKQEQEGRIGVRRRSAAANQAPDQDDGSPTGPEPNDSEVTADESMKDSNVTDDSD